MIWTIINYGSHNPPVGLLMAIYFFLFIFTFKHYLRALFGHPNPLVRLFLLVLFPLAPYVVIYGAIGGLYQKV